MLRVPTSCGRLYFKAPMAMLAHEARVIELLAARRPGLVTELVAADHARGWMVMRDGGTQLSSMFVDRPDLRYWHEALPLYAELQREAAADAAELVAAGAFDRRTSVLTSLFESLVDDPRPFLVGDEEGLTEAEFRALRRLGPRVAEACAELAAGPVPETIQNDDFSDGSIFVTDSGGYRFLDWGDACVSHPFFTLTVTLRVIAYRHELPVGAPELDRARDAYLEPWTVFADMSALRRLAGTARWLGQLCRALLWKLTLQSLPEHDRGAIEPDTLPWSARMLIDPEAWREDLT